MEVIIELNDALDTATFYGVNNINILCLKNQHPDVRVIARGYQVKIIGSEPAITRFEQNLRKCETFCIKNNTLTETHILQLLHGEQPTGSKPTRSRRLCDDFAYAPRMEKYRQGLAPGGSVYESLRRRICNL